MSETASYSLRNAWENWALLQKCSCRLGYKLDESTPTLKTIMFRFFTRNRFADWILYWWMMLFDLMLPGICRNRDIAKHYFALHRYQQAWWLLCSTWSVSCNLYCPLPHMGSAEHICTECHSSHWYGIYLLAGKYPTSYIELFFFYRFLLNTISYAFRIFDSSCAFES